MHHLDRNYIIVGGTAGMGRAAAELLSSRGAQVAIIGRDPANAQSAASTIAANTNARIIGDGGPGRELEDAVRRCASAMGGLDGLAITAGPINSQGSIEELDDDAWAEAFETQVMTVVRSVRAALPIMAHAGGGALVTTAALSIHIQKHSLIHYAAMKSAIASLTKHTALFHGGHGIRANCIAPGAIATEALDDAMERARTEIGGESLAALWQLMRRDWGSKSALDRIGEPREVAELIAFLLSPASGYLTGATINIDGGTDF